MDEVKIWALDGDSNVVPLALKGQTDTESLLEETVVRNPDLLIPGLRLVGRQTLTDGGPLDLLGVDEDGRLVVFEGLPQNLWAELRFYRNAGGRRSSWRVRRNYVRTR